MAAVVAWPRPALERGTSAGGWGCGFRRACRRPRAGTADRAASLTVPPLPALLSWPTLTMETWVHAVLHRVGLPAEDAALAAAALTDADRRGLATHGLARLAAYIARLEAGEMNPVPRLRCVEKLSAKKAEAVARVESAKVIDTGKIEAAFAKASSILKAPKLRVAGMTISHAKATSANAGAIYVKAAGTYLGKIMGGKFIRSRDCDDASEAAVLEIANDPKEAAIKYGRVTGCCACCGRPLENKESVERGIGPVCAEKFGWGS